MNLCELPFNKHLGLQKGGELLKLPYSPTLLNHLGTIHAGAIYTLAEAASGEFLVQHRAGREDIGGVVRKAASKYSAPGTTDLFAKCDADVELITEAIAKIDSKGMTMVQIPISVYDDADKLVGKFTFNWLLGKES